LGDDQGELSKSTVVGWKRIILNCNETLFLALFTF